MQISRPGSIHGGRIDHKRLGTAAAGTRGPDMAAMGGGRINGLPRSVIDEESSSSDDESSDWDDWQNADYIEEQREALR